ncbi:MAG: 4-alpha-glucanotransferase, partial [Ferruginibacter sp.]
QNWLFPTYNIAQMRQDDFAWFNRRMKSLQKYFDALRIDHVLGLFRIWSIPKNQVNGTMGIFVPAIPLKLGDFTHAGLFFNEERLCNAYTTDEVLNEIFGDDVTAIKTIFLDGLSLKKELNDQQKIEKYLISNPEFIKYKQQLFDIVANVILLKDFSEKGGYHFRINVQQTISYKHLTETEKYIIDSLYKRYFFEMQNALWEQEGKATLKMLTTATNMLVCAEDLGMVPAFTEKVLQGLDILSLQVQQMPKESNADFSDTKEAAYGSVVMPATHDMAPIRLWWEQNRPTAQLFYNSILKEMGNAPYFCEPWICKKIIELHQQSPAMWSVFLLQDLLAINGKIRRPVPTEERINDPANPKQIWNYRMHLTIETLMQQDDLNNEIKEMITAAGR